MSKMASPFLSDEEAHLVPKQKRASYCEGYVESVVTGEVEISGNG